jgi:hypothetical protein
MLDGSRETAINQKQTFLAELPSLETLGGVPWRRRLVAGLSSRRPGFEPRSFYVRFVVGKVALGQVSQQVSIILPLLYTRSITYH